MTDYEYDENLPYVAENDLGFMVARFVHAAHIKAYLPNCRVIDTTPKPRVPDDAEWITWYSYRHREHYVALNGGPDTWRIAEVYEGPFEDLPGVTPDTVFTVLDERKN